MPPNPSKWKTFWDSVIKEYPFQCLLAASVLVTGTATTVYKFAPILSAQGSARGGAQVAVLPIPSPIIATFDIGFGQNEYRQEFRVFNDNELNLQSSVSFRVVADSNPYLVVTYQFPSGELDRQVVGVDAPFSPAPYQYFDASAYRGIRAKLRWVPGNASGGVVEFYFQAGDHRVAPNAWPQARVAIQTPGEWTEVKTPFDAFAPPPWAKEEHGPLDRSRVFKFGILIHGSGAFGELDVDDIGFVQ